MTDLTIVSGSDHTLVAPNTDAGRVWVRELCGDMAASYFVNTDTLASHVERAKARGLTVATKPACAAGGCGEPVGTDGLFCDPCEKQATAAWAADRAGWMAQ